ncbi:MAG: GNAT family N-acetyltransferase [Devosia sp.]
MTDSLPTSTSAVSAASAVSLPVVDNAEHRRFEVEVDDELAYAKYRLQGQTIRFLHTFVPEVLRGRGIATQLILAALDSSRSRGLAVVPRCPLFRNYMARHRESQDLLSAEGLALVNA